MTDDNSYAVALRIARQVMADADAEYRANPGAGMRDDLIVRKMAHALDECVNVANETWNEKLSDALGAIGRQQA